MALDLLYTEVLARELNQELSGQTIQSVLSSDKETVYLQCSDSALKIQLFKGQFFLERAESSKIPSGIY